MDNYKFQSLLAATSLSDEERHNLCVIFSALTPERQFNAMDNWGKYRDSIVFIQNTTTSKRNIQIEETFARINRLIDEASIRDSEKRAFQKIEKHERDAQMIASLESDQKSRSDIVEEVKKIQEQAREKLDHPLSFI